MTTYFPAIAPRRSSLVASLVVVVALVCGPLAFAPSQAAGISLSGLVVDSAGAPVEDGWVEVYVRDDDDATYYRDPELDGFTDASGRYALDLEPGTYKLRFTGDERHVAEYYDDAPTLREATAVVLTDQSVEAEPVELATMPAVTGTVTAANGPPIRWGYVVAFQHFAGEGWDAVAGTDTDSRGEYVLPLETGTYRIGFFDEDDAFVPEYWDDAPSVEQAKDITVDDAGVEGIDATLAAVPAPIGPVKPALGNYNNPTVTGFAAVGRTVLSLAAMWRTTPTQVARQWLRNGSPIPGATGTSYRVTSDDLGARLSIQETGSRDGFAPATLTSAQGDVVRWSSKLAATSKPGRKKATLSIKVTVSGGVKATGTVTIKRGQKTVRTVRLKNGQAVVTLKRLKKSKQKYDIFYNGSPVTYGSRTPVWVKIKK